MDLLQTDDWSVPAAGDQSLYWNPGAISYLAELLLAVVLATYLGLRVYRDWRQGRLHPPTLVLTLLLVVVVPGFLTSLFRVLTAGGWVSYAMPWSPLHAWTTLAMPWARPFAGATAAAHVLFAYIFPRPLPGAKRERTLIVIVLAALIVVEIGFAFRTDAAIIARVGWWRPDWIVGWINLAMIWAALVFWRQFAAAQREARLAGQAGTGAGLFSILRPAANREASAARGYVLLTLLPIIHTMVLFLRTKGRSAATRSISSSAGRC